MPGRDLFPSLWHVLHAHMAAEPQHRVIVFFTTARAAQFYANLMRAAGVEVRARRSAPPASAPARFCAAHVCARGLVFRQPAAGPPERAPARPHA